AERFRNETARVFRVLDQQLADKDWIATPEYSIADISAYGRVRGWKNAGVQIDETPRLKDWLARIEDRPAVKRAHAVIEEMRAQHTTGMTEEAHSILYGARQMAGR
ncbi:MAG: glutathione binding-like protein, partial [Alphaproteobacteria bacterium]|nr:glutathione binding-like protein [Alphaproteobacteria bacterium]